MELRRQALDEERRRREQVERRLQSESARRQQLVEKEVKMREKQFSQVRGWGGALGGGGISQGVPAALCNLFYPRGDCCWLSTDFYLGLVSPKEWGPSGA